MELFYKLFFYFFDARTLYPRVLKVSKFLHPRQLVAWNHNLYMIDLLKKLHIELNNPTLPITAISTVDDFISVRIERLAATSAGL